MEQELTCQIMMTESAQYMAQVWRADKSSVQMIPIAMQQPYKRLSRLAPIFFLQQIKHQREHIGRLRVCARQAVRRNEVFRNSLLTDS